MTRHRDAGTLPPHRGRPAGPTGTPVGRRPRSRRQPGHARIVGSSAECPAWAGVGRARRRPARRGGSLPPALLPEPQPGPRCDGASRSGRGHRLPHVRQSRFPQGRGGRRLPPPPTAPETGGGGAVHRLEPADRRTQDGGAEAEAGRGGGPAAGGAAPGHAAEHRGRGHRDRHGGSRHEPERRGRVADRVDDRRRGGPVARHGVPHRQRVHPPAGREPGPPGVEGGGHRRAGEPHRPDRQGRHGAARSRTVPPRSGRRRARSSAACWCSATSAKGGGWRASGGRPRSRSWRPSKASRTGSCGTTGTGGSCTRTRRPNGSTNSPGPKCWQDALGGLPRPGRDEAGDRVPAGGGGSGDGRVREPLRAVRPVVLPQGVSDGGRRADHVHPRHHRAESRPRTACGGARPGSAGCSSRTWSG